jgi:hypothetical protein
MGVDLLVFTIVVVVVAAILIVAVRYIPIPTPFNWIVQVLILLVAALVILSRLGVFH